MAANQSDATSVSDVNPQSNSFSGYFFRIPDELDSLMDLTPAELKVYLVITRAIQRDKNKGELSTSQIVARAKVTKDHANRAANRLCKKGLLVAQKANRKTTVYSSPIHWKAAGDKAPDYQPTSGQPNISYPPTGGQCYPPTSGQIKQNYPPTGGRHSEKKELSESSSGAVEHREEPTMIFSSLIQTKVKTFFDGGPMPNGPIPVKEIEAILTGGGAKAEDLDGFFLDYKRKLKETPRTWGHVKVSLTGYLSNPEVSRTLKDRFDRAESIRRANERRQVLRDKPMPLKQAEEQIERYDVMRDIGSDPRIILGMETAKTSIKSALIDELKYRGVTEISPRELLRMNETWKPSCQTCRGNGWLEMTPGSMDTLFEWCDCEYAERKQITDPNLVEDQRRIVERWKPLAATPSKPVGMARAADLIGTFAMGL